MRAVRTVVRVTVAMLSLLAGLTAATAQPRYSVNVLAYADVNLVTGSNLVGNPFNAMDHKLSTVLRGVPEGSYFLKWNPASAAFGASNGYSAATGWAFPDETLATPHGGFLWVPQPARISFVGEVSQSRLCIEQAPGDTILNLLPGTSCGIFCGNVVGPCPTDAVPDGTQMLKWVPALQTYEDYTYINGFGWSPAPPTLAPGESARFIIPGSFYVSAASTAGTPPQPAVTRNWQRTGANLSFEFQSAAPCSFSLYRSSNLNASAWTFVGQHSLTPTGGVALISLPIETNGSAFYRLLPPFTVASAVMQNALREGDRFRCEFFAPVSATYELQRTTSALEPVWQTVASVSAGASNVVTIVDAGAAGAVGYYRLRY